jgi:putative membrane protein
MDQFPSCPEGGSSFFADIAGSGTKAGQTAQWRGMNKSTLLPIRFAALFAAAFLALQASAQPTDLKHSDKSFIEKAAKAGAEEVDISLIVVDRTMNPMVKEFAQMIVTDHTGANEALAAIAASKGVQLPPKDPDATDKWAKKTGKDFDEDYINKMIAAHKDAVELFQKEADKGDDPQVKAFARDTLPKLQHHLAMAMDLKKTLK